MFKFSKFQKGIKFFKIKFSCINLVNYPIRFGINHKMWLATIFSITIILPCFIKPNLLFVTQAWPEFHKSSFVFIERQRESFIDSMCITSVRGIPIIKVSEFGDEGNFEIFGGFIEFISPVNVFAQEMSGNAANERTNNTKSSGNICYFKGSKFQFYLYSFLGGFTGIAIGVAIIILFFYFTQQLIYPTGFSQTFVQIYFISKKIERINWTMKSSINEFPLLSILW